MQVAGARRSGKNAPTIGVLIPWFEESYSRLVASGLAEIVHEEGGNLVGFVGGRPNTPRPEETGANLLYDWVSRDRIDGLILMSGVLVQFLGDSAFSQFCGRFAPLPMVSISVPVAGVPSVTIDNDPGLRDALHHLIDRHGRRRIAFVGGPHANAEAVARFHVYRDALHRHGIAFDPALVAPGTFDYEAGESAVRLLLEERRVEPDALVAANDSMALGAVEALRARRLRVPEDVSVVGFDDAEAAAFASPSLTTVRQPLRELGRVAARLLMSLLRGGEATGQGEPWPVLPTEVVIRESCGCVAHTSTPVVEETAGHKSGEPQRIEIAGPLRAEIISQIAREMPRAASHSEWAERLVDALAGDTIVPSNRFLRTWDETLNEVLASGADLWPCHHVLSALRHRLLPTLVAAPCQFEEAERLLFRARDLLGDKAQRHQGQRRLAAERRARSLNDLGRRLMAADDLVAVGNALDTAMSELGVERYFIVLYDTADANADANLSMLTRDEPGPASAVQSGFGDSDAAGGASARGSGARELSANALGAALTARLVLAKGRHDNAARLIEDVRFHPRKLLPDAVLADQVPFDFVAEPFYVGTEPIGYGLFDCTFQEGTFYDDLRHLVSSTLKRLDREALLLGLHQAEKERSEALERAYQLTRQNQERLVLSEHMAALGRLTAGMAHEMNTPLAAVRMALDELAKLTDEYASSLGDPDVGVNDHRQIAREMDETVALAEGAVGRVAGFVQGIHFQTNHTGEDHQRFNLVSVIQDTLLLLRHALRKSGCSVSFEPSMPDIPLYGSPGRLAQVVTNLVTNAMDASRGREDAAVIIRLAPSRGRVRLTVSDRGSGIAPEDLQRIFDPMFTTKPFGEGTGLGLSIVHSIVVNEFRGTIEVDSELDRGTTFTLHLLDSRGA